MHRRFFWSGCRTLAGASHCSRSVSEEMERAQTFGSEYLKQKLETSEGFGVWPWPMLPCSSDFMCHRNTRQSEAYVATKAASLLQALGTRRMWFWELLSFPAHTAAYRSTKALQQARGKPVRLGHFWRPGLMVIVVPRGRPSHCNRLGKTALTLSSQRWT